MRFRRIVGGAAAVVVSGAAGLLLSTPTGAVTPPFPISLDATGMSSSSCPVPTGPLGVYQSIAVKPKTPVQFKPGLALALGQSMTVSVRLVAASTPAPTAKTFAVPKSGLTLSFPTAGTYALDWKANAVLGVAGFEHGGKLVIDSTATSCVVGVQLPVPNVSAPVVPSAVTSRINAGASSVVSAVNGAVGAVNSAVPPLPTGLPAGPGLPLPTGLPGPKPPAHTATAGPAVPGTYYKPTGPTVADRTVPKGYGNGSGLGGSSVSLAGHSITAPAQQSVTGNGNQSGRHSSSTAAASGKSAGAPKTVELASKRPRSALGGLPTLAVILAVVALSGATAFYARTFLLHPAAAESTS